jgi:DNA-binding IclR family transcriptional regulator
VADLVAAYRAGSSSYALAEQFGLSKSSVLTVLHEHGLARRRRRGMTQRQQAKAIVLYELGWSIARIATGLGLDDSTVHRRLRAAGVQMRDQQGRTRPRPPSIGG